MLLLTVACGVKKAPDQGGSGPGVASDRGEGSPQGSQNTDTVTTSGTTVSGESSGAETKSGLSLKIGPMLATGLSLSSIETKPVGLQLKLGGGYNSLENKPAKSVQVGTDIIGGAVSPFVCDVNGFCNATFTPTADFKGKASFTYTVSDGANTADGKAIIEFGPPATPGPGGTPVAGTALTCGATEYAVQIRQVLEVGPPTRSITPELEADLTCSGISDPAGGKVSFRFRANGCNLPNFNAGIISKADFTNHVYNNIPSSRACETIVEAVDSKGAVFPAPHTIRINWTVRNY